VSWYTPTELAKRVGFYSASQAMGGLMASALQSAIYKTLNGAHGIAGWRWGFIINGIMTVVVAVAGLFFIPDYPDRPK
jgi:sugar phosphate permease